MEVVQNNQSPGIGLKPENLQVRNSTDSDLVAIESLYLGAFPEEDLVPLVKELLHDSEVAMSLIGTIEDEVVGHAIFTYCSVPGYDDRAALLGPLAVDPSRHRHGIGRALVESGVHRLLRENVAVVFVLGDP